MMDYEEVLKNRQEVLDLVNAGNIQEAFSRLIECSYTCPEDNSQHSAAIKAIQEQIIEGLIRLTSDQNYREIFIILNRLISFLALVIVFASKSGFLIYHARLTWISRYSF